MILTTCGHRRIPTLWRLIERNLSTKSPPAAASQDNVLFHTTLPTPDSLYHQLEADSRVTPENVLSHTTLPTPKMRALILLYHQADSWVTPENLLQKIDEAFVQSGSLALSAGREENMVSVSDMRSHISVRRNAPKIAQWDTSSSGSDSTISQWSESGKSKRDLKVLEALYGVTTFDHSSKNISQAFLPGLEVLQESASSAVQDHKDDREAEDLQDQVTAEVCFNHLISLSSISLYHVLFTGFKCAVKICGVPMNEILQMHFILHGIAAIEKEC
jgi:hypothetical protein